MYTLKLVGILNFYIVTIPIAYGIIVVYATIMIMKGGGIIDYVWGKYS